MVPEVLRVLPNFTQILESRILKWMSRNLKFCIILWPLALGELESRAHFLNLCFAVSECLGKTIQHPYYETK